MENSDDYDFNPSTNSKLKSLFDSSSVDFDESDLTYTAPKQPRPSPKEAVNSASSPESTVICAKIVQVWKLINGKYTTFGKLGLAIIGLTKQNKYEMILYKDKQNISLRLKINESLKVCLKNDCFVSFYDNLNENWLVKFNNDSDLASILKEIEKLDVVIEKEVPKPTIQQPEDKIIDTSKTEIEIQTGPTELDATQTKTDILNRIAKMGQSILPKTAESVETETILTDSNDTRIPNNQLLSPALVDHTKLIHRTPVATTIVGQYYDPISMLCTENRTHNTEIRMNLSQISEKLNNLMTTVDKQKPSNDSSELKSKLKVLNLKNENLERDLLRIQNENRKLQEAAKDNSILIDLENCKAELQSEKQKSEARFNELSEQLNKSTKQNEIMSQRIDDLNASLSEKSDIITQLEQKISELQEKNSSLVLEKSSNKDFSDNFKSILKTSMNEMYNNIMVNIGDQQNPNFQNIIAQNIKSTTLNILQHLELNSDKLQ